MKIPSLTMGDLSIRADPFVQAVFIATTLRGERGNHVIIMI
jgi:hypothetical protein